MSKALSTITKKHYESLSEKSNRNVAWKINDIKLLVRKIADERHSP